MVYKFSSVRPTLIRPVVVLCPSILLSVVRPVFVVLCLSVRRTSTRPFSIPSTSSSVRPSHRRRRTPSVLVVATWAVHAAAGSSGLRSSGGWRDQCVRGVRTTVGPESYEASPTYELVCKGLY